MNTAMTGQSYETTPLLCDPPVDTSSSVVRTSNKIFNNYSDEEARNDTASLINAESEPTVNLSVGRIVSVLLIGSFISSADGSLLFATHPIIASEFNALHDSSWLMTSFALAQAVTLPLYGKLSDIYGRKSMLLVAYTLFAVGCALVGIGQSMSALITGRVISGAGSSGMTSLISIIITDLVPLRDVATWRSYVNIAATTGRSIGGPLGGWLADSVGWRWSFIGQVPPAGIAMVLIGIILPSQSYRTIEEVPKRNKVARIDFIGAVLMTLSILCLLIPLEIGGDRLAWSSPIVLALLAGIAIFGTLFFVVEGYWAREPILPLILLRNSDVVLSGLIMFLQSSAQTGLMFAVPLYFQVTSGATNTIAGAHLVPAVIGNAIGGLIAGRIINRTGRYKILINLATIVAASGYLMLILRWHGNTNWLESFYIFPGGFGMGLVQSSLFISIQAAIDPSHTAVASSTLYLMSSIGFTSGMAGVSAVLQGKLRFGLKNRLVKLGFGDSTIRKIIEHAVSDVRYGDRARPLVAKAVRSAYIDALTWTHAGSFASTNFETESQSLELIPFQESKRMRLKRRS